LIEPAAQPANGKRNLKMTVSNALRDKWKISAAKFERHALGLATRRQLHEVLHLNDTLQQRRTEIAANHSLSAIGQRDALAKLAAAEVRGFATAQRTLAAGRANVREQRRALTPTVSDKTNVAAAMLRAELRTFLRSKNRAEIAAIVADPNVDETILEALFEGSPLVIGLDAGTRDQILSMVVSRRSAPAVEALSEQSDALDVLQAGLQVAGATLATAAGVTQEAFPNWLSETAPLSKEEVEAEAGKFHSDVTGAAARALPLAARLTLVDQLLAANTAEIKGTQAA
jgi:hypothetical protein